jgi:hypothetical protein
LPIPLGRGISVLGELKQLTIDCLNELQEMPDLSGLTAVDSLTIKYCHKLRALTRGITELGTLRELTLEWSNEMREMPDLSGLSTLEILTIEK